MTRVGLTACPLSPFLPLTYMQDFFYALSEWAKLMATQGISQKSCRRHFFREINRKWLCSHDEKNMDNVVNREGAWHYHPTRGWIPYDRILTLPMEERYGLTWMLCKR